MRIAFLVLDRPLNTQRLLRMFPWARQIYILPFHSIKHNIQKTLLLPFFPAFLSHTPPFLSQAPFTVSAGEAHLLPFHSIKHNIKGTLPFPTPHHTPHAPLPHSPPSTPFPLPPSPAPSSPSHSSIPHHPPTFFSSTPSNPPLFSHPHHRTRTSKP